VLIVLPVCAREQVWLCMEVEDTGIGIRERDRPFLFQPFLQLAGAVHTRAHTGTGLGALPSHYCFSNRTSRVLHAVPLNRLGSFSA
jgi:signal transduction histidine kinase